MSASCQHYIFDFVTRSKLLLEGHELIRQSLAVLLGDVLQGIFEEDLGAVVLTLTDFELGKVDEELLIERTFAKFSKGSFEVEASI